MGWLFKLFFSPGSCFSWLVLLTFFIFLLLTFWLWFLYRSSNFVGCWWYWFYVAFDFEFWSFWWTINFILLFWEVFTVMELFENMRIWRKSEEKEIFWAKTQSFLLQTTNKVKKFGSWNVCLGLCLQRLISEKKKLIFFLLFLMFVGIVVCLVGEHFQIWLKFYAFSFLSHQKFVNNVLSRRICFLCRKLLYIQCDAEKERDFPFLSFYTILSYVPHLLWQD